MKKIRLAILGLGNVPLALLRYALAPRAQSQLSALGAELVVTGVTTGSRGNAIDESGIALELLEKVGKRGNVGDLNRGPATADNGSFIGLVPADILFVATPAKVESVDEIRQALGRKMHVITSNKTPIAGHYHELLAEAHKFGVALRFGATVLAGFPPWKQYFEAAPGPEIATIEIVVNATSNNILTLMLDRGVPFEEGVVEAQRLGIAERDPSDDVDGHDTQKKLVIIANALMGARISTADVPTEGIRGVTIEDLRRASNDGKWIHLLGRAWREAGAVRADVKPTEMSHPFFSAMRGTAMGLYFKTQPGDFGIRLDLGAGTRAIMATGAGVYEDILSIAKAL